MTFWTRLAFRFPLIKKEEREGLLGKCILEHHHKGEIEHLQSEWENTCKKRGMWISFSHPKYSTDQ